jgi:hypothetical protein
MKKKHCVVSRGIELTQGATMKLYIAPLSIGKGELGHVQLVRFC